MRTARLQLNQETKTKIFASNPFGIGDWLKPRDLHFVMPSLKNEMRTAE